MEEPEIVLGPGGHREVKPGMMTIKIENTKMDITKEDTIPLAVWFGFKVKGKKDTMNLNIRPITGFNCGDYLPDTKTWIRIRFIADQDIVEGEDHYFLMTVGGWENLKLEPIAKSALEKLKPKLGSNITAMPNPDWKPPPAEPSG